MRSRRAMLICLMALAAGAVAHDACAAVSSFRITNNSGAARSDLHLEFSGTGGTATLAVTANAPGCPPPAVTNPGTPWTIDWGTACVDPGETVTVRITSEFGGVAFASGFWTLPGSANVPLNPGDVQPVATGAPTVSKGGLAIIALLLIVTGSVLLKKRTKRARGTA